MNTVEKVVKEVRTLPEFELREVLDFVGFLKTKHGVLAGQAANNALGKDDEQADWAERQKLARELITEPIKTPDLALMNEVRGKIRTGATWARDELYDRGIR